MKWWLFPVIDHSFTIPPGAEESRLRIINGDKANRLDWPWQVALQNNNGGQERFAKHLKLKPWYHEVLHSSNMKPQFVNPAQFCGGSIVTPRFIITAAHCTEGETVDSFFVTAGHIESDYWLSQYEDYYQAREIEQILGEFFYLITNCITYRHEETIRS